MIAAADARFRLIASAASLAERARQLDQLAARFTLDADTVRSAGQLDARPGSGAGNVVSRRRASDRGGASDRRDVSAR